MIEQVSLPVLTPDGSELLAADLLGGSLAVINPDSPTNSYFIPIAPVSGQPACNIGPMSGVLTSVSRPTTQFERKPLVVCVESNALRALTSLYARPKMPLQDGLSP